MKSTHVVFGRGLICAGMLLVAAAPARAGTVVWAGSNSTDWATAANWTNAATGATGVPADTDDVVINGGANQPTLNLGGGAVTIASLTIGETAASTLTFHNGNGTGRKLVVTGNATVGTNGTLTHTANSSAETHRLFLDIGGDLYVTGGGRIDVEGHGYTAGQGPGRPSSGNQGGSHGGLGGSQSTTDTISSVTYGSVTNPVNLGSGGNSGVPGGGAIRLNVAGVSQIDGTINARGASNTGNHMTGAGGSVFLTTGTLEGIGAIRADGGNALVSANAAAGGGRIAVIVSSGDFSAFAVENITAHGGLSGIANRSAAAGTVYLQTQAQGAGRGTLIIDNTNYAPRSGVITDLNGQISVTTSVGDVIIRDAGRFHVGADDTLIVYGSWSNAATFTADSGGTVEFAGSSSATLWGSTTFARFICATPGKTLTFEADETFEFTTGLRLIGASGDEIEMVSTDSGVQWNLLQQIDHTVQYVAVSNSNADSGGVVMASYSTDNGGNANWIFSDPQAVTWAGAQSTEWNDPANWNPARPPLPDDPSITIPGAPANQPTLDTARTFNGSLVIENGATLTLAGNDLTINGTVTNAGTLTATGTETLICRADVDFTGGMFNRAQSALVFDGSVAQTFKPGDNTFYDITIPNTNTLTVTDAFAARDLMFLGNDVVAVFNGAVTTTNIICHIDGNTVLTFDAAVTVVGTFSVAGTTATNTFSGGVTADTFHSLNTGGGLLMFGADADFNIRVLALRGGSSTNLLLRSSSDGTPWNLYVTGFNSVRFVDARDSDASGGVTIYAIDSAGVAANNTNWDFGSGRAWVGTTTGWATDANWSPAEAPGPVNYVVIDGDGAVQPTLDLDGASVTILNLVIGASSASTLTFSNGNMDDKRLIAADSVAIGAYGTLTHTLNPSSNDEVHKLHMDVGTDLDVTEGGRIDVEGRGFRAGYGPGTPSSGGQGGSYGGLGGSQTDTIDGLTYGSVTNPVNLGSGGSNGEPGGGAIRLNVAGVTRIDGTVSARGASNSGNNCAGAGGSVFLTTGTLAGSGAIRADGGHASPSGNGAGGGGRIAVVVNEGDFSAFSIENVTAYGGVSTIANRSAAAGTVYLQTQTQGTGRGTLIVDNNDNSNPKNGVLTDLNKQISVTTAIGDLIVRNAGRFHVGADDTLIVHGNWYNQATFTADSGSTVEFAGTAPATVWGNTTWQNLTIATHGKRVHFQAGATQTINGVPTFENVVWLLSTVPGSQWNLIKPGVAGEEQPVGAVVVQDSDARGGRTFVAGRGSASLGNNLNWTFPPRGSLMMVR